MPQKTVRSALFVLVALLLVSGPLSSPALGGAGGCRGKTCTKDVSAPLIDIVQPSAGASVTGIVRVYGTASDDTGVRRVEVSVDGGVWQAAAGTTSWETSLDAASLSAGTHLIEARAVDGAGKSTVDNVSVTVSAPVDTTAPSVTIAAPVAGSTVTGSFTMSGTASDNTQVVRVDVRVNGASWTASSGTTAWQRSLDASAWAAGTHVLEARSVDGAGNTSSPVSVTVQVSAAVPPPAGDPSIAPDSQGSWTSPEGVFIEVATAGPFTVRGVYKLLIENASAPGDLGQIGPNLTIRVQDTYADFTSTTAVGNPGAYTSVRSTVWLKGVGSTFSAQPDEQFAHEYGHAWTRFHLYLGEGGDWAPYLSARGLAGDARLDTSYSWSRGEIIAEDYRLLFGSAAAAAQWPNHMNVDIAEPDDVLGLRDYLLGAFRTP